MTKTKTYLIILFAFFYLHVAQAQGSPPTPGDGGNVGPGVPIDGGIIALLAAGGAMGYKKLKNKRNDTTE
jgi:hypothetical protein